jgi:DNA mismatch repair protein MSH5
MQINTDALVSLQIFLNEKHASVYSNVVKEGLSIYGKITPYHLFIGVTLIL